MAKNSNGLGSITYTMRDGKKYWTGRVTVGFDLNGNQIRRSFSGYKKYEVIEKMQAAQSEIATSVAGVADSGDTRLGALLKHWIFNVKIKEIKSTTIARYDQILRLRIEPYAVANTKIKDVTILLLQNFINSLLAENGVTENMVKDTLNLLKNFLDYTVVIGALPTNPARLVKIAKTKSAPKSGEKKKVYRIFSAAEQQQILNFLNLDDVIDQMIFIDFFTGLRRNELRGLKWKNFTDSKLKIEQQIRRSYTFEESGKRTLNKNVEKDLKTTNSFREIPLPSVANNLIKKVRIGCIAKHLKLGIPFTEESYIFSDFMCRPIEEKRTNRRIKAICKKLGIEERPLHSVRHSYATRLFEKKVDIKTVQHLMGHSDFKTTLNVYTHVMPEVKEEAVKLLNDIYQGII